MIVVVIVIISIVAVCTILTYVRPRWTHRDCIGPSDFPITKMTRHLDAGGHGSIILYMS